MNKKYLENIIYNSGDAFLPEKIRNILDEYLFKLATSLFTKANITYAVSNYSLETDNFDYLRNLLATCKYFLHGVVNQEKKNQTNHPSKLLHRRLRL